MKSEKHLNLKLKSLVASLTLLQTMHAHAGTHGGNGGGAWVCRETSTHEVRWSKLVDTFEATANSELLDSFTGDGPSTAKRAKDRLKEEGYSNINLVDSDRTESTCPFFIEKVKCGMDSNDSARVLPDDASIHIFPTPESCAGGVITREAVAIRSDGLKISLVPSPYRKLSPADQVALAAHEMLFAMVELFEGDVNSDRIRPLVAKLTSDRRRPLNDFEQSFLRKVNTVVHLDRYFRIEFDYDNVNTGYYPWLHFASVGIQFDKSFCKKEESVGSVAGEQSFRFHCMAFSNLFFNDPSWIIGDPSKYGEDLFVAFLDQIRNPATHNYHLVVTGIGGEILNHSGHPTVLKNTPRISEHVPLIEENIW